MLKKIREFFDAAKARQENEKLYLEAAQLLSKADRNNRLYLALLRETRSLNRTVRRQGNTIRRLRAKLSLDAPTTLPPLAQSPEGRALYNHAYQMGRRKGRKDILDEVTSTGATSIDRAALEAMSHADSIGTSSEPKGPFDPDFDQPTQVPAGLNDEVARVKETAYVDTAVPMSSNDEVTLGATKPALTVVRNEPEDENVTRPGS